MNSKPLKPRHVVVLAALALAGCQQKAGDTRAPEAQATSAAAPDAKPGITVSGGVLVLPAVKGNPGAAYFSVTNGGNRAASLAAVSIGGAVKAEMHETKGGSMAAIEELLMKPGETAVFKRGGKHVMAFGIADSVTPGGTAEMTLTFAGGDKISAPLEVQSMTDALGGDMAAIDRGSRN